MTRFFTATPLLILMCFFAGCTSYWYQEGNTFEECKQDIQQCRSELKKYTDEVQHSLGVYDIRFEKECMKEKGYRLVWERDLPLKVKRQSPHTAIGEKYGAAGTLEE